MVADLVDRVKAVVDAGVGCEFVVDRLMVIQRRY